MPISISRLLLKLNENGSEFLNSLKFPVLGHVAGLKIPGRHDEPAVAPSLEPELLPD